ncbi:hypothetical protein E2320_004438 [Naja naja]|nr:hypothetical protein E2320_004438 [Naja naja]
MRLSWPGLRRALQLTLAIVKPDAVAHPLVLEDLLWTKEDSQSGPMRVYILAHEEAITRWRSLMGPTKVYRARHTAPESIRGSLGLTDTRNSVHGSVGGPHELELHYSMRTLPLEDAQRRGGSAPLPMPKIRLNMRVP